MVLWGAATIEIIKQYSFDRAFMGSCGIDMTDGTITTLGVEDGLTKKPPFRAADINMWYGTG